MHKHARALLFANGQLPESQWLPGYLQPEDYLVAVDGGYTHLKAIGRRPHLLIGDLDSIDPHDLIVLEKDGVEVLRFPSHKDQTDLELALTTICERGYAIIRVVAAFGGRLDQTLANAFLLDDPALESVDLRCEDGETEAFLIRSTGVIHGRPGDLVSLLPVGMPAEGVTTHQLAYPLYAETLYPYRSRGVSNVMESDQAEVSITGGKLLCLHLRRF